MPSPSPSSGAGHGGSEGGVWPAADFQVWPATRVSALVVVGVGTAAILLLLLHAPARGCCTRCSSKHRWTWPILNGLAISLYLHFIPCIWWTCDWGPHDGEGVRGGIWFGVWFFYVLVCYILNCRDAKETPAELQDEAEEERKPAGSV